MYFVDKTEPMDSRRTKVYVDGEFAFVLYNGEMHRLQIEEGRAIREAVYQTVLTEILPKRAKERALYYLKAQARTEKEVREKLRQGLYPDAVIMKTVAFLRRYHYLDDEAYARNFIELSGERKSRLEIEQKLKQKGIDSELIRRIYEELAPSADDALKRILKKRHFSADSTPEENRKTIAYLMRRGFRYEEVRRVMVEMHNNAYIDDFDS